MTTLLAVLVMIVYTISWVGYSKYQFIERDSLDPAIKKDANIKWHRWEFVNHVSFLGLIALYAGFWTAVMLTFGYQLMFNTLINVYALKGVKYYHLGDTGIDGWMKKKFGEKKAYYILIGVFVLTVLLRFLIPIL